jgi:hypothetical protein
VLIDPRDKVTLIDNVAHVKGTVLSEDGKKFVCVQTFNLGECELEGSLGVNMDEILLRWQDQRHHPLPLVPRGMPLPGAHA